HKYVVSALIFMAALRADEPPWFSHKLHAPIGLACTSCHPGGEEAGRAGMPPASRCLAGHKDTLKLRPNARAVQAEDDNIPDYVGFSHARHARGKIKCVECHGEVNTQEQTGPANALNMKTCMDCHTARKATLACGVCHSVR